VGIILKCNNLAEADTDIAFFLVRGLAEATWSNQKKTGKKMMRALFQASQSFLVQHHPYVNKSLAGGFRW
jgi:uncharacterized protein YjgD (DUF1641 family)